MGRLGARHSVFYSSLRNYRPIVVSAAAAAAAGDDDDDDDGEVNVACFDREFRVGGGKHYSSRGNYKERDLI